MKGRIAGPIAFVLLASSLPADISVPVAPPPQADAQAGRVWRGDRATIALRGHHGGGSVTFWIARPPEHGKLSALRFLGDNRAAVTYENDGAQGIASDSFSYVVKTSSDRNSSPAEVRISIEEPPARMRVPARIEFGEILAGASETRRLEITNEGGGVLEGRLTVSAPWQLESADYRVESGQTEAITVRFRPNEGRAFVGQITLTGVDGGVTTAQLQGAATSPVLVEPARLQIDLPPTKNDPRAASVSLTNQTERTQRLTIEASASIQTIEEVVLAPREEKKIAIVVLLNREIPLHEEIALAGSGFKTRLQVDADGSPIAKPKGTGRGSLRQMPSLPCGWRRRIHRQFSRSTPNPRRTQARRSAPLSRCKRSGSIPHTGSCAGRGPRLQRRSIGSTSAFFH